MLMAYGYVMMDYRTPPLPLCQKFGKLNESKAKRKVQNIAFNVYESSGIVMAMAIVDSLNWLIISGNLISSDVLLEGKPGLDEDHADPSGGEQVLLPHLHVVGVVDVNGDLITLHCPGVPRGANVSDHELTRDQRGATGVHIDLSVPVPVNGGIPGAGVAGTQLAISQTAGTRADIGCQYIELAGAGDAPGPGNVYSTHYWSLNADSTHLTRPVTGLFLSIRRGRMLILLTRRWQVVVMTNFKSKQGGARLCILSSECAKEEERGLVMIHPQLLTRSDIVIRASRNEKIFTAEDDSHVTVFMKTRVLNRH